MFIVMVSVSLGCHLTTADLNFVPTCMNVALRLAGCHQACISRLPFPYLCVFWNWCIADQLDPVISMKFFENVV